MLAASFSGLSKIQSDTNNHTSAKKRWPFLLIHSRGCFLPRLRDSVLYARDLAFDRNMLEAWSGLSYSARIF